MRDASVMTVECHDSACISAAAAATAATGGGGEDDDVIMKLIYCNGRSLIPSCFRAMSYIASRCAMYVH